MQNFSHVLGNAGRVWQLTVKGIEHDKEHLIMRYNEKRKVNVGDETVEFTTWDKEIKIELCMISGVCYLIFREKFGIG